MGTSLLHVYMYLQLLLITLMCTLTSYLNTLTYYKRRLQRMCSTITTIPFEQHMLVIVYNIYYYLKYHCSLHLAVHDQSLFLKVLVITTYNDVLATYLLQQQSCNCIKAWDHQVDGWVSNYMYGCMGHWDLADQQGKPFL